MTPEQAAAAGYYCMSPARFYQIYEATLAHLTHSGVILAQTHAAFLNKIDQTACDPEAKNIAVELIKSKYAKNSELFQLVANKLDELHNAVAAQKNNNLKNQVVAVSHPAQLDPEIVETRLAQIISSYSKECIEILNQIKEIQ